MRARLWQFVENTNDSFWLRPALIVVGGIALAVLLVGADRDALFSDTWLASWIYSGGETGARTLLGAIAGSTIGVAGTVFSITIATLTLASNQMGPRLLRNFTRDRGNQATLGVFVGTFAYALLVLRTVRGAEEGAFVPHLAISGAVLLALACVGMLIYFVHHIASRINADAVIDLVHQDLHNSLMELTTEEAPLPGAPEGNWSGASAITDERSGYIQQLDEQSIADWAQEHGVSIRLFARVGAFVFPGTQIAAVLPHHAEAEQAVRSALALGPYPTSSMDIEYSVTQLTDIAVRALSSGINDPNTAIRVLDRFGAALCTLAARHLPSGVLRRDGRVVFERDRTTYPGLADAMFHPIRQSAGGSPSVLIRIVEVLTKIAECERRAERLDSLARHGTLLLADALASIRNAADRTTFTARLELLARALTRSGHRASGAGPGPSPGEHTLMTGEQTCRCEPQSTY